MVNFHHDIQENDVQTGEARFKIEIGDEEHSHILPTCDSIRHFNGIHHNFEEEPVMMAISATLTTRSQIINTVNVTIPPRSTLHFSYEMNSIGLSDIDAVVEDADGQLQNPYFLLGSNELRSSSGLAGGKIVFEIDSRTHSDTRAIEYTLVDNDLVLDLEADNISEKRFRLRIFNCYLYNASDNNLLDFQEILEVAFFPGDRVNLKIKVRANGNVSCRYERV